MERTQQGREGECELRDGMNTVSRAKADRAKPGASAEAQCTHSQVATVTVIKVTADFTECLFYARQHLGT